MSNRYLEALVMTLAVPFIGEWWVNKGQHPYHAELDDTPPAPANPKRGQRRAYEIDPLMHERLETT
jgi:hypothetical protein